MSHHAGEVRGRLSRCVRATSVAPAVSDALKRNSVGEIHSVFERTFNILIGEELVGVAQSGVSPSPINLITDIPSGETMQALGIKKGMPVQVIGNRVLVGEVLEISLEGAELWRPKTRAEGCLSPELIRRNLGLVTQHAVDKTKRGGLGQLLPHIDQIAVGDAPRISGLNAVAEAVLPRLVDLVSAVGLGDVEKVEAAARKLVGLGPGLSPSADDALAGFTATLWWISHSLGKNVGQMERINATIAGCASVTTLLSQQLLKHAAKGETNERVGDLLESILAGPAEAIERRVERVLEIGETSGIDTMVGLLLGLNLGLRSLEKQD